MPLLPPNTLVDVTEYSLTSVSTPYLGLASINNHQPMRLNGIKLAISMARATATNHLDFMEYWSDVIQSVLNLNNLVDRNPNNLRLKSSRLNRLRDFTRTNKVGELAQAIAWMHVQENSLFPYIADFELFCSLKGITIPSGSSTPDYIAQKSVLTNVCLVESKGTLLNSVGSIKSKLKKSLAQCAAGTTIINGSGYKVTKSLCFCTEFSTDSDFTNTNVHFVDPEDSTLNENKDDLVIRLHYATWFYILGDYPNVQNLLLQKPVEIRDEWYDQREINGRKYFIAKLPYRRRLIINEDGTFIMSSYPLESTLYPWDLGIPVEIVDSLKSEFASNIRPYDSYSDDNIISCKDGTIITRKSAG